MDQPLNPGRNWLAVASAEHVRIGRREGFMQVNHGKLAPLRRIQPGDLVIYYSPSTVIRGKDRLQSFTAIGRVRSGDPYQGEMSPDVLAYRRDVDWFPSHEASIQPLVPVLDLTAGKANWGYQLRFGLLEVSSGDAAQIADLMGVGAVLDER